MTFATRSTAFLLLMLGVVVTLQFAWWTGRTVDFALAALFVFALFFRPVETLVWAGVGAWLLNWQPALSIEMALLVGLPVLVSVGKQYIPGRGWVAATLTILLGITLFYSMTSITSVWEHAGFFVLNLLLSLLFGLIVVALLSPR